MSPSNPETPIQETRSERLRAVYRASFAKWASQVSKWQAMAESESHGRTGQEEKTKVEETEAAYREARNLMADDMTTGDARTESKPQS